MKKLLTLFALLPFMAVNSYGQYAQLGDVNVDGSVDISDVVALVNIILSDTKINKVITNVGIGY